MTPARAFLIWHSRCYQIRLMKDELTQIVLFLLAVAVAGMALYWLSGKRQSDKWENRRRIGFAPEPAAA